MRHVITAIIALIAGFSGAGLYGWSGLGGSDTRAYLMANPEVLPEAMDELQRREVLARIEPLRADLETPYPGAVLGNPQGSITLVEFTDYACGYCRQSLSDVHALIEDNPDLRVVIREYPVLAPQSVDAARMALAAAQQGKFAAFHDAMFTLGNPSEETIQAAAEQAGLDLAQANSAIELGLFDTQLQSNVDLAQRLGVSGTPSWVVGDMALSGAVGRAAIEEAIAAEQNS